MPIGFALPDVFVEVSHIILLCCYLTVCLSIWYGRLNFASPSHIYKVEGNARLFCRGGLQQVVHEVNVEGGDAVLKQFFPIVIERLERGRAFRVLFQPVAFDVLPVERDGFGCLLAAPRRVPRVEVVFPCGLFVLQDFPVVFVGLFQPAHLEVAPCDGSP